MAVEYLVRRHLSSTKYQLLRSEFQAIVSEVETVPPNAQEAAFNALVSALLDDDVSNPSSLTTEPNLATATDDSQMRDVVDEERNYVAEIKQDVAQYDLGDRSDVEFAAYISHYFLHRAPAEKRLDTVTNAQIKTGFSFAARKPPKGSNYNTPLKNAKQRGYLDGAGKRGHYKLSDEGKYHVEQVILKAEG